MNYVQKIRLFFLTIDYLNNLQLQNRAELDLPEENNENMKKSFKSIQNKRK